MIERLFAVAISACWNFRQRSRKYDRVWVCGRLLYVITVLDRLLKEENGECPKELEGTYFSWENPLNILKAKRHIELYDG